MQMITRDFFLYTSFSISSNRLLVLPIGAVIKIMTDAAIKIRVKVLNFKGNLLIIPKLKKAINTEKKITLAWSFGMVSAGVNS